MRQYLLKLMSRLIYCPCFDQTRGYEVDSIDCVDSFLNTEVFKNQQDARSAKERE